MKKLFFLGSSTSGHGNKNLSSPSIGKQVNRHDSLESGLNKCVGDKQVRGFQSPKGLSSKLREPVPNNQSSKRFSRSCSLSSKSFVGSEPEQTYFSCSSNEKNSPSSSSSSGLKDRSGQSSRGQTLIPQKQHKANKSKISSTQMGHRLDERPSPATSSRTLFSGNNQKESGSKREINSSDNKTVNGVKGEAFSLQAKHMDHSSPKAIVTDKQNSHSIKESQLMYRNHPSRDWLDSDFRYEFPQRTAQNVIEQLSQSRPHPKSISKDHFYGIPKSGDDIFGKSVDKYSDLNLDMDAQEGHVHNAYERVNANNHDHDNLSGLKKKVSFLEDSCKGHKYIAGKDNLDTDLGRSLKQAEKRIMLLYEELEQDCFLQNGESDVSALMQRIRDLTEEKLSLSLEVSILLQSLITERSSVEKRLGNAKVDLESRTRMLEKERNELLSTLDKELERRTNDWSFKLKKYQLEEQRLRDQVRELAEQNVSLQRRITFNEGNDESRSTSTHMEQQLKSMTARIAELCQENWNLQKNLCDVQEKCKAAEKDRDFVRKKFNEDVGKKLLQEKLQMEQIRLADTDLALKSEVESYRMEIDSLRGENISLLNSLKRREKDANVLPVKLDIEIWTHLSYLQNQGLSMLNESIHLCSKLLDLFKEKTSDFSDGEQGVEFTKNGTDGQFINESEMKVHVLKQETENLKRNWLTMLTFLHEKSSQLFVNLQSESRNTNERRQNNDEVTEADLANAIRGNDILRHEVQIAMDNLSRVTHKMLNQNENISKLQNSIQQTINKLTVTREALIKVTQERDFMLVEVGKCTEKNMILSSEVQKLKTQIEACEEEILVKDGQITILKDSMSNKSLDPFANPNSARVHFL